MKPDPVTFQTAQGALENPSRYFQHLPFLSQPYSWLRPRESHRFRQSPTVSGGTTQTDRLLCNAHNCGMPARTDTFATLEHAFARVANETTALAAGAFPENSLLGREA